MFWSASRALGRPTTGAEAPNIAYWDSNTVSGDGSLASAADYQFRTTVALVAAVGPKQAPGVLTATAIAGVVGPRTLEGVDLFSVYKDVHVLKLADQSVEQGGVLAQREPDSRSGGVTTSGCRQGLVRGGSLAAGGAARALPALGA